MAAMLTQARVSDRPTVGCVRVYDGQFVIVLEIVQSDACWIVFEDDRLNTQHLVMLSELS